MRRVVPVVVIGGLVLCALEFGLGDAKETEVDTIRRLLETQVEGWNRNDLDAFLKVYWNDPGVVFQSGANRVDGFEALRAHYRQAYPAEGREMGKLGFSNLDVITFGSEAALARGRWQLTKSDGKRVEGLFTLLLRKFPEGWRIVHDHTSS